MHRPGVPRGGLASL
ncbi:hypothetical protein A2U01_0101742 [Trifolium medium]|uniref:Uncharacterized protein n=1 Tax=Trifolium medium TaxID=97028 RepID=A0A392V065_9FABA|nr:hypothetical protein [Trifolium medium]